MENRMKSVKVKNRTRNRIMGHTSKGNEIPYQKKKTLYSCDSSKHCLEQPRNENYLSVHQLMKNEDIPSVRMRSGMNALCCVEQRNSTSCNIVERCGDHTLSKINQAEKAKYAVNSLRYSS